MNQATSVGLWPTQLAGMALRDHLRIVDDHVATIFWPAVGRSRCSNSVDRTNDLFLHRVPLEIGATQAQLVNMLAQRHVFEHALPQRADRLTGKAHGCAPVVIEAYASTHNIAEQQPDL